MSKDQAVIDRLRKLLARTIENGCSENEAAAAAAAAARLMAEHALTEQDAAQPEESPLHIFHVDTPPWALNQRWHLALLNVVGSMFGVAGVVNPTVGKGAFIGDPTGIALAAETFVWLRDTGLELYAKRREAAMPPPQQSLTPNPYSSATSYTFSQIPPLPIPPALAPGLQRTAYMAGFVDAVARRIYAERQKESEGRSEGPSDGPGAEEQAPRAKTGGEIVHDRTLAVSDRLRSMGSTDARAQPEFHDPHSVFAGAGDGSKVPLKKAAGLEGGGAEPRPPE